MGVTKTAEGGGVEAGRERHRKTREKRREQCWRAVPSKGQRKEETRKSRNNQSGKKGGVRGREKVISSSPPSSVPFSLPNFLP